jgi:hypothetical protein
MNCPQSKVEFHGWIPQTFGQGNGMQARFPGKSGHLEFRLAGQLGASAGQP